MNIRLISRYGINLGKMGILLVPLLWAGCLHHGESLEDDIHHRAISKSHHQSDADVPHFSRSMEKELLLTKQQKQSFDQIKTDYEKMVLKTTAKIRSAEIDLANLLGQDDHDRKAIQAQVHDIANIREELMMARVDSLLTLKAILTRGQYRQFQETLQERMKQVAGHDFHGGL